ncbi:MAG: hypothetical protein MRK00_09745 [Nitrosomonas sp.]|nr:hypothetical protein [Nitrosomonas sp.]
MAFILPIVAPVDRAQSCRNHARYDAAPASCNVNRNEEAAGRVQCKMSPTQIGEEPSSVPSFLVSGVSMSL